MSWIIDIRQKAMNSKKTFNLKEVGFYFFIRKIPILFIILFFPLGLFAQELTEAQKQNLEVKIKLLLKDYELYNQFTTNGVNIDNEYIRQFYTLFETPSKTGYFNDLAPSGKGSFATPQLYTNFVVQFYKQGLDVTINRDQINIVDIKLEKGKFKIYTYISKKITGIYNNQGIYKFNNELCFIFTAMPDEKGEISNLKINGIITKDRYAQMLSAAKGKGLYAGIGGMYNQTQIFDDNLYKSGLWSAGMQSSINPQFDLNIMFTRGFGIGTGVRLTKYQTAFTLSGYNNLSEATIIDEDNDSYHPRLSIDELIDTRTIASLDIPFMLKFRMGKGKVSLTLDMGVIYSMYSEASFTLEGNATRSGYYPDFNAELQDIPELGFGTYNYSTDEVFEMQLPESGLSGYAGLGFLFQLSPRVLMKIGTGVIYGITPFALNNLSSETFYDNPSTKPSNYLNYTLANPVNNATIRSAGAEIGLIFKLF